MDQELRDRISESMKGNQNARKWDEPLVIETLEAMIVYLTTDVVSDVVITEEDGPNGFKKQVKKIKTRPHLKKQASLEFGIYQKRWFAYIATQFKSSEAVCYLLNAIDDICIVNTYDSASKRVTDPSMAKMNLSHHYNWSDKTEIEHKGASNEEDLTKLSTHELKRRIEASKRITESREGDSEA